MAAAAAMDVAMDVAVAAAMDVADTGGDWGDRQSLGTGYPSV